MEKLRKIIIILIIIMIIIICTIALLFILKGTDNTNKNNEFENDTSKEEIQNIVTEVTNRNEYYAVKNIIGKYAYAILDGGKQSICDMLNKEYVNENSINENNIEEFIEDLSTENLSEYELNNFQLITNIDEMLYIQSKINIKSFFVYGNISNNINNKKIEFKNIVEIDSKNNTFSIYPTSYVEKHYTNKEDINKYKTNVETIDSNNYNNFSFVNINDTTIINDYMTKFKDSLINVDEYSFNLLEENYRKNKFDSIEEYKEYVNANLKQLLSINITKYKKDNEDDQTRYICLDDNGNYYIINERAIMNFSIMLDTYTTVIPEYAEKYDNLDNNRKVAANIDKIVQALNKKDYKYIYTKLDEKFKENNFSTLNKFKNYFNEKFPSTYDIEYTTYREENGTYIQNIILKDKDSDNKQEASIIMQLKENYDFVMSFSI